MTNRIKDKKTALVCLNGQPPTKEHVLKHMEQAQYVVAADGGVNWLMGYNLMPNLVIGDLDSANPEYLKTVPWQKISDQNTTDLEKAMHHILAEQFSHAMVMGMEQGRADHALSNFFLLSQYAKKLSLELIGSQWKGLFITENTQLRLAPHTRVSLIPFMRCQGVVLDGFLYTSDSPVWNMGQVGVSNVALAQRCTIQLERGLILAMIYDLDANWALL